jgi:hypothetical protein
MRNVLLCVETTGCDLRAKIEKITSPVEHRTGETRLKFRIRAHQFAVDFAQCCLLHLFLLIVYSTASSRNSSSQQEAPGCTCLARQRLG